MIKLLKKWLTPANLVGFFLLLSRITNYFILYKKKKNFFSYEIIWISFTIWNKVLQ